MTDRPEPPPWGTLIADSLRSSGISAREAARRAGISEGRWRQISSGYQVVSPGAYARVRGPAATLAKMAAVAGVTPAELRASGRHDAAEALVRQQAAQAQLQQQEAEAVLRKQEDRLPREEMLERLKAMDIDQARELLATIAVQLGMSLPEPAAGKPERRYGT
jgi:transcriptional regulator with XRE-family HTH domain